MGPVPRTPTAADTPGERPVPPDAAAPPIVVRAPDLFGSGREVLIEHEGVRYRLRITRRNKLILQK